MKKIDFEARRKALAANLREADCDVYLVTRQGGLHYLCGVFIPWRGVAMVTAKGDFTMFYWTGDASRVKAEGVPMEVVEYDYSDLFDKVHEKLYSLGITSGRIAVDLSLAGNAQPAPGILTASEYIELLEKFPGFSIVNGVKYLDSLLLIKSEAELERLRYAAAIADYGYEQALKQLKPGMTENQVAGILEHATRDRGSYWAWSVTAGTEVGSGPRSAFYRGVTQISSERIIQKNEFVILDFHPCYDLYLCDYSIPVFLGEPNEEQRHLIECWEEAVDTVFNAVHPGVRICDAVDKGINVYKRHGLYDYCLQRFGHGLGVCVRTAPTLDSNNTDKFRTGMTFTLGAHLYKPGVGGLRLEYPVAVGDMNAERLASTPMKVHIVPVIDVKTVL